MRPIARVRVGKHLSDIFPIWNGLKQGDALSPLLFNFALEYTIRRVQVNRDCLKLSGSHHLLAYADDVNTFAASYLNAQGLNNSCLKSPASTLVDLIFNRVRSVLSA